MHGTVCSCHQLVPLWNFLSVYSLLLIAQFLYQFHVSDLIP
nr:MAG TPA: hypothetical protein [Caudoviricetes sp.]